MAFDEEDQSDSGPNFAIREFALPVKNVKAKACHKMVNLNVEAIWYFCSFPPQKVFPSHSQNYKKITASILK